MANVHCPNCRGCKCYNRRSTRRNGMVVWGVGNLFLGVIQLAVFPPFGALFLLASPVCLVLAFVGGPSGRVPLGCWICNFEWDDAYRPPTAGNLDLQRMGQILLDQQAAAEDEQRAAKGRRQASY